MVSFKLFAGTHIGLRENNEDNFTVCPDLTKNEWIVPADNQQVIPLGLRGCIMVVADGMGGQNAGEVASAIAISTVQEMFAPDQMSAEVFEKPDAIKTFLKKVILECDIRVKKRTAEDPSTFGMGSTIVISWLIDHKVYIAWLGDSRAYSFIKNKGIARLSKDHSYVQQLVDAGKISDDEAMIHPNSNIITRSLGDSSQKAKAEVIDYDVEDGQIILLCSDGLCGVCRDEEIGSIIEEEADNLKACKEKLTDVALAAGGSDNITISLMQIKVDSKQSGIPKKDKIEPQKNKLSTILVSAFGLCLLSVPIYLVFSLPKKNDVKCSSVKIALDKDTLSEKETTRFYITHDDSLCKDSLIYDKNLIDINCNDSTVCVKKAFSTDKVIPIVVICKNDTSIADTINLCINKKKGKGKDSDNSTPSTSTVTDSICGNNREIEKDTTANVTNSLEVGQQSPTTIE